MEQLYRNHCYPTSKAALMPSGSVGGCCGLWLVDVWEEQCEEALTSGYRFTYVSVEVCSDVGALDMNSQVLFLPVLGTW